VSGGQSFIQIVMGGEHTCGLSDAGQAFCWGDNSLGQLGDGTQSEGVKMPVPVGGEHAFFWLAGADHHTCGLDEGRAFCWGFNDAGQLGDGTVTMRRLPEPVVGDYSFVDLAADYYHTCGLDEAGSTYCWGSNPSALGDGTRVIQATPEIVSGGPALVLITAGGDHTCGLDGTGQAICWGVNDDGELGDGTMVGDDCGGFPPCRNTPLPVSGGHTFVWLDAGQDHNCGMESTGRILCWGRNAAGQLGDGTTIGRTVPVGTVDPF
jgi:alpha-tubulin suppressor-like RCC1 family protein